MKKADPAYRDKRTKGKASFDQYCHRILDLKEHIQATPPSNEGPYPGLYIVHLSEECRMTVEEGHSTNKTVPRDKASLAEALNLRNCINLGIPDNKDFIVLDHDGTVVARMYRNKLSEEEADAWSIVREHFNSTSVGWSGSCEAAPYPMADRFESQLRSKQAATAIGIADKMVIKSVGPKKEGKATGVRVKYLNAKGRVKEYGMGVWINRMSINTRGMEEMRTLSEKVDALIEALSKVYVDSLGETSVVNGFFSMSACPHHSLTTSMFSFFLNLYYPA